MDFSLSGEQCAFQETAREFARTEWLPHAAAWDKNEEFPVAALRAAAALGFAGIYVKEEFGGSALTRLDAALIFEELATACASTAAYLSIHNMASWMIDRFGDRDQRARLLPRLMSMEHFASYCLTEPGSGSDAAARSASTGKMHPSSQRAALGRNSRSANARAVSWIARCSSVRENSMRRDDTSGA